MADKKETELLKKIQARMSASWQYRKDNYDTHLKEIVDHVYPQTKRFLMEQEKHDRASQAQIVNNIGKYCLTTLAAGMQTGIASPSRPWFSLGANNVLSAGKDTAMISFLQELQSVVYKELAASNVYQVLNLMFKDQGAMGTACSLIDDEPDADDMDAAVLDLIHQPFGTYAIDVDYKNRVTALYHYVEMTLEELLKRFPESAEFPYPEKVKTAKDADKYNEVFKVAHVIEKRREDKLSDSVLKVKKPFVSYWFLDQEKENFLSISGFDRFPAVVARWEVLGNDRYGESPASQCSGDFKELQKTHLQMMEGTDRAIRPPMLIPTTMRNDLGQLNPGGRIFYDPQIIAGSAVDTVKPAVQIQLDYSGVANEQVAARERIRQTFFTDLFLMLDNFDKGRMTATEVAERKSEKMLMLGSILERQNVELLEPIIEMAVERVLKMNKRYPELVQRYTEFSEQPYTIEFVSILAQAQKAAGSANLERATAFLGQMAQASPDVADRVDFDAIARIYCDMNGVPADVLRSDEAVNKIRNDRAQAQQAAAQQQLMLDAAQAANNGAQAAKAVSDLPVNPNTVSPI